ncbi:MAG: hypothetical protein WCO85_03690 [Actinomycetes bacterium]
MSEEDVAERAKVVEKFLDTLMNGFVLPTSTTTILQDWQKSRHSEVNEINGLVVRKYESDVSGLRNNFFHS